MTYSSLLDNINFQPPMSVSVLEVLVISIYSGSSKDASVMITDEADLVTVETEN